MSKNQEHTKHRSSLNFEEAKQMTIEEAVRKDNHLKVGITDDDSVLDRYIKQHREEIGSKKFETQTLNLDTKALDDFIKKQRESVDELILSEESDHIVEPVKSEVPLATPVVDTPKESEAIPDAILLGATDPVVKPFYKKRGLLIAALVAFLVAIFGGGYLLSQNLWNKNQNQETETSKIEPIKQDTQEQVSSADKKAFDDLYATFFVDSEKTQLKNDQMDRLAELQEKLDVLKGTSAYDDAKLQFDRLSKQMTALKAINDQFNSPVIVDGAKVEAVVLENADFDRLGSDVLSTGNAHLDNLIQSAISEGRKQKADMAQNLAQAAQVSVPAPVDTSAAVVAPAPVEQPSYQVVVPEPSQTVVNYGITNYDPSILQRHLSRVPYNHDVIADSTNPAWQFNEGVLERILDTSRARGYITGNDFILERVNIINGNGYYNMFKPDGTYLFSINAKTGYFVGNGRGYADALDY
ncbi:cell division site-positioning protein MapZ family protein [Streptococcus fryi]